MRQSGLEVTSATSCASGVGMSGAGSADSLERAETERKVKFRIADGLTVNDDARLLNIVLYNLIGNAWKYSGNREGTAIEFGVIERG